MSNIRRPALLLPAGTPSALDAAIKAGADEIYFGARSFNARMGADNFSPEEILNAVQKCHFYGVKTNVTLNTSVHDREYGDLLRLCEFLYRADCDSIICADPGVCALIRQTFPDFRLHASTQCAGHNVSAAKTLKSMGYCRMVVAREASFEDILLMRKEYPEMEYEIFVHGALCVCHSGMCSLSACMGGRSGNRGSCAQPCRLPDKNGNYPLSLKDLCLASYIPEIIRSGVAALKVEGRMKSPEYVFGVGSIYRALLDENREPTQEELTRLERLFSRDGFTDGYFTKTVGRGMLGTRSEESKAITKDTEGTVAFEMKNAKRTLPVTMTAEFIPGTACRLQMTCNGKSVTVYGSAPEIARTAPLTADGVRKNLSKLGATPFSANEEDVSVILGDDVMLPVSAINSLRRTATDKLMNEIQTVYHPERADFELSTRKDPCINDKPTYHRVNVAHFTHASRMPGRMALSGFSHIFLPIEEYLKADESVRSVVDGVEFPSVVMQSEYDELEEMAVRVKLAGINRVTVSNIGSLNLALKYGFTVHGGLGMNVQSAHAAKELAALGFNDLTVSCELKLPAIKALAEESVIPAGVVIYGKIPVMTVEKCVIRDIAMGTKAPEISRCAYCDENDYTYLTDRRSASLPVRRTFRHRNVIYNSIPIYMADKMDGIISSGIGDLHYYFTDESAGEAAQIIESYKNGSAHTKEVKRL